MKFTPLFLWLFTVMLLAQEQRISLTDTKPRIAILPFGAGKVSESQVFDKAGVGAFAEAATQKVLSAFVEQKRFIVIERGVIDQVLREQDFQMGEFADPDKIASFGSLLGSQYIVIGQIMNVSTTKKEKKYRATVQIHLRIIDVSSGQVKAARDVSGTSDLKKELSSKIAYDALDKTDMTTAKFVRAAFPIQGKLVKLLTEETKKKKDKSKKPAMMVLISCGREIGVRVGDQFNVVQEEAIAVDGQTYNRQKAVGKLKVKELEMDGIFSVCEVVEGKKIVEQELNEGRTLTVLSVE